MQDACSHPKTMLSFPTSSFVFLRNSTSELDATPRSSKFLTMPQNSKLQIRLQTELAKSQTTSLDRTRSRLTASCFSQQPILWKDSDSVSSTFHFTKQDISAPFFSYETLGCGARPVGHWVWLCETCDELLAWNVRLGRTAFERKSMNAQKRGVAKVWVGGRFWANESARPPTHHLNQRKAKANVKSGCFHPKTRSDNSIPYGELHCQFNV